MNLEKLAATVCDIATRAGQAILDVYQDDHPGIEIKEDFSPLTRADLASHQIIETELAAAFPDMPLLSEESAAVPREERRNWIRYWLVDPLDGTKEFIRRNGEFTVNIALIEHGNPILGVVYAPALDRLYWGYDSNAWCRSAGEAVRPIRVADRADKSGLLKIVASRSHRSPELDHFLETLPAHECIAMGSSLKLCLVAEGRAHLYPRIGPTMEWDTAAADAIVRAAGGTVTTLDGRPFVYNKVDLKNPDFLAKGQVEGL
ncbi:MAG: 3'(2'),5'-bisphosphate nucleotidase CysQ [Gammaproteobacteria bacterium]